APAAPEHRVPWRAEPPARACSRLITRRHHVNSGASAPGMHFSLADEDPSMLAGSLRAASPRRARHPAASAKEGRMKGTVISGMCGLLLAMGAVAQASTLTQNLSWTVDRAGTSTKYRVVAYGDSIYAGYYGSITNVIKRAATTVDSEYLSSKWG